MGFFPFLRIGKTFADFHAVGKYFRFMALLNKIVKLMITIAGRCLRQIGGMLSNPLEVLFGSFFSLSTNDGGLQKGNGPSMSTEGLTAEQTSLKRTMFPSLVLSSLASVPKGGYGGVNQLF